jgi:hypothetical protein
VEKIMATKIEKGAEVWMLLDWNHRATVSVRRLTVQSFGKEQGTATYSEGNKFLKCRIYPSDVGKSLFHVADVDDIDTFALAMAVQNKAKRLTHYVDKAHWYCESSSKGYHESMKKDCEAVIAEAPAIIYR